MFSMITNKNAVIFLLLALSLVLLACGESAKTSDQKSSHSLSEKADTIRFASYNISFYRKMEGDLAKDLQSGVDSQIQNVAAVIQHVRPDVLALMEFDYDASGELLDHFQENYLSKSQFGEEPISYNFAISVPSNTGVLSDQDLDSDGKIELPADAYGFGRYEGQYAFALFSKFPIDSSEIRSFQKMLWSDMPNATQPKNEDGSNYYSEAAWNIFRISSKNHIDIPLQISKGKNIHTILAHPTPPVFDGPEDRNGLRNYDEIRLLNDYISGAEYLIDDQGRKGGLSSGKSFVVMGDLNADPIDGDSSPGAIDQLLSHDGINEATSKGNLIPSSKGGENHNQKPDDKGDPAFDTAFFGKRIDYVLPSNDLKVIDSGIFWPAKGEPLFDRVKDKKASDHLLVWVDVVVAK